MMPTGIEWIIIAIIIIVLLLWGPSKLPKIARSLGEAKKEFQKAMREAEEIKEEARGVVSEIKEIPSARPSTTEDKLIEVAKALGIETEGKTRDQIAQEILERTKKPGAS